MKFKSVILLAVAVGFGVVAMLGVRQVLSGNKPPAEETIPVLVAITEIPSGSPLNDKNVAFKKYPVAAVPKGAVTKTEEYEDRALRISAVPGEIIFQAKLSEKGKYSASNEIPDGHRLMSVPVNLTKTHSGLIRPGDRVDILLTYKVNRMGQTLTKTRVVLEHIAVFAMDSIRTSQASEKEGTEIHAKNISFLVTPDQANLLALAENKGTLTLTLRSNGDDTKVVSKTVDESMLDEINIKKGSKSEEDKAEANLAKSMKEVLNEDTQSPKANEPEVPAVAPVPVATQADPPKPKPTWTLKIYEGKELREEKVELREEAASKPEGPTATPASTRNQANIEQGRVKDWLVKTFLPGKI